ncbi:hypothetical protein ACT3CE_18715, partial [Marinifilum sp. RC60d5]|uniref:hypothetical protein n=1 Tax=Marinifilum sp. RC60d5 TaxID=3458414 RepID=UPI004036A33C
KEKAPPARGEERKLKIQKAKSKVSKRAALSVVEVSKSRKVKKSKVCSHLLKALKINHYSSS